MSKGNEPAFCTPDRKVEHQDDIGSYYEFVRGTDGLTKRELFAAMAMQGFISTLADCDQMQAIHKSAELKNMSAAALVAELAVGQADALISELEKTNGQS